MWTIDKDEDQFNQLNEIMNWTELNLMREI